MWFFKYQDYEIDFFHNKNKFLYFTLFNILLFSIGISVHNGLAVNSVFYASMLLLLVVIIFFLSRKKDFFKSYYAIFMYAAFYLLFAITNLLPMDFIFIGAMLFFVHLSIKVYPYIFLEHQDTRIDVWHYAFLDDFDKSMSLHKFGIPLVDNHNKTRLIDEEIKLMRAYNKVIFFKNKISEQNFGEIGNLNFYVPKSLALVVYQTIINYCVLGVASQSNNPITIKVRDYTDQSFNIGRGDYMLEFEVDQENLQPIIDENGNKTVLSDAIEEILTVSRHKNMSIYGIDHGINNNNKKFYVIRIKYKKPEQIDEKVLIAVQNVSNNGIINKTNQTQYENVNS